jgi:hypothetical protein
MTERKRSWVPACSGAAVGPAIIRREEHLSLCVESASLSSARLPRTPDATGILPCENGDSSGYLLHCTISNREANGDPTTRVVVV